MNTRTRRERDPMRQAERIDYDRGVRTPLPAVCDRCGYKWMVVVLGTQDGPAADLGAYRIGGPLEAEVVSGRTYCTRCRPDGPRPAHERLQDARVHPGLNRVRWCPWVGVKGRWVSVGEPDPLFTRAEQRLLRLRSLARRLRYPGLKARRAKAQLSVFLGRFPQTLLVLDEKTRALLGWNPAASDIPMHGYNSILFSGGRG